MTLRVGLALVVMLSMALARMKRDQMEDMVLPVPLALDCTSSKLSFYKPAVV